MKSLVVLSLSTLVLLAPLNASAFGLDGIREMRPNVVGLELGGRGGIYSGFYERYTSNRVGFGVAGAFWAGEGGVLPMYVSFIPAGDKHGLYFSLGATFFLGEDISNENLWLLWPAASAGYQFQSERGLYLSF
jgi:hypothetical protein